VELGDPDLFVFMDLKDEFDLIFGPCHLLQSVVDIGEKVPLLLISLAPRRDTPARLAALASAWELGPEDRMLSGSVEEVERALNALGIARRRDGTTGDIYHAGTVMVLDHRSYIGWRFDGGWGRVRQVLAGMPP
jgi:cytochrome oxidase Cu insertion factor (SCO1/SenC/PrrC family)